MMPQRVLENQSEEDRGVRCRQLATNIYRALPLYANGFTLRTKSLSSDQELTAQLQQLLSGRRINETGQLVSNLHIQKRYHEPKTRLLFSTMDLEHESKFTLVGCKAAH